MLLTRRRMYNPPVHIDEKLFTQISPPSRTSVSSRYLIVCRMRRLAAERNGSGTGQAALCLAFLDAQRLQRDGLQRVPRFRARSGGREAKCQAAYRARFCGHYGRSGTYLRLLRDGRRRPGPRERPLDSRSCPGAFTRISLFPIEITALITILFLMPRKHTCTSRNWPQTV